MKEMKEDEKELKGVEATSLEGGPNGGTEQGGSFGQGEDGKDEGDKGDGDEDDKPVAGGGSSGLPTKGK